MQTLPQRAACPGPLLTHVAGWACLALCSPPCQPAQALHCAGAHPACCVEHGSGGQSCSALCHWLHRPPTSALLCLQCSRAAGSMGVPGLADELAEPLLFCEMMVFGRCAFNPRSQRPRRLLLLPASQPDDGVLQELCRSVGACGIVCFECWNCSDGAAPTSRRRLPMPCALLPAPMQPGGPAEAGAAGQPQVRMPGPEPGGACVGQVSRVFKGYCNWVVAGAGCCGVAQGRCNSCSIPGCSAQCGPRHCGRSACCNGWKAWRRTPAG